MFSPISRAGLRWSLPLLLVLVQLRLGVCRFMVVSVPGESKVMYAKLLSAPEQARDMQMHLHTLLSAPQVRGPRGLAIDQARGRLFVADTVRGAVLVSQLYAGRGFRGRHLASDEPTSIVDTPAHFVAVDSLGNLFCSDPTSHKIVTLHVRDVGARLQGSEPVVPTELYSAASMSPVRTPRGIAADGFNVFWVNGASGRTDGTLVRGFEEPPQNSELGPAPTFTLASNTESAWTVCLSNSRIFYSDQDGKIYSTGIRGGEIVTVNSELQEPLGCAFDGDGTVFVTDPSAGGVFGFSGGAPIMGSRYISMVIERPGTHGIAIYSPVGAAMRWSVRYMLLLVLFFTFASSSLYQ